MDGWIGFALEEEFFWKDDTPAMAARRAAFLNKLADYAEFAQVLMTRVCAW